MKKICVAFTILYGLSLYFVVMDAQHEVDELNETILSLTDSMLRVSKLQTKVDLKILFEIKKGNIGFASSYLSQKVRKRLKKYSQVKDNSRYEEIFFLGREYQQEYCSDLCLGLNDQPRP